jgi:class 3 adenylate cyclase
MGLYAREGIDDLLAALNQPARPEEMTLLFADMRGSTRLSQSQEDPARTQQMVNDLFTMLAEQVITRGGIVNKFLGDAVFAFFRRPGGPERAVRCAFGMLERFESLRERWGRTDNRDLAYLDLGVGITTDRVAVGTFGSATVRDFTAIGTAVNLAAAFVRGARGGRRVLVDHKTWNVVKDILADCDPPVQYKLRKPGQPAGMATYPQYHVKRLKPDFAIRVFVSHSHLDRLFVEQEITGKLKKLGIDTWYSNADIVPGENYIAAIEDGLLKSDWVVVVVSENAARSDWVRAEVRTALKEQRLMDRILPVIVDDTEAASIWGDLGAMHALDARTASDLGDSLYKELSSRTRQSEQDSSGMRRGRSAAEPGRQP